MKKLIAIILATLMLMALASCNSDDGETEKKSKKKKKDETTVVDTVVDEETADNDIIVEDVVNGTTDEETEYQPPVVDVKPQGAKYKTISFVPYGDTEKTMDTFVKYLDDFGKYYITTDGKIVSGDHIEGTMWYVDEIENIAEELLIDDFPACKDENGVLYISGKNNTYAIPELEGEFFMSSEMITVNGRELYVFTIKDNKALVTSYSSESEKTTYDAYPVSFYDATAKKYFDKIDDIKVIKTTYTTMYVTINGELYQGDYSGLYNFDDKTSMYVHTTGVMAEDVVSCTQHGILYKKSGSDDALYYGKDALPVYLPDGKTVDNITKAVFGPKILLFFDDGSVYTGYITYDIAGPKLEKDDLLTDLHTQGAIVEVYQTKKTYSSDGYYKFLLNDNVTYVFKNDLPEGSY